MKCPARAPVEKARADLHVELCLYIEPYSVILIVVFHICQDPLGLNEPRFVPLWLKAQKWVISRNQCDDSYTRDWPLLSLGHCSSNIYRRGLLI